MVHLYIATDERDKALGTFFLKCTTGMTEFLVGYEDTIGVTHIDSDKCNEAYVEISLNDHQDVPFIFLTYMHGVDYAVRANKLDFVKVGGKNSAFRLTLFYAVSCLSGLKLGPDLVNTFGCQAFIGYEKEVITLLDDYEKVSIRCFNWGIQYFISKDDATIIESFNAMKNEYTKQINQFLDNNDIIKAGILIDNRDSLVLHGNELLTKTDLLN